MTTSMTGSAPAYGAVGVGAGQALQFEAPAGSWNGPAGEGPSFDGPAEVGEIGIAVPGMLLIDSSWSMDQDLSKAQAALERFAVKLRQNGSASANAWLSIVTFADTARTDLPITRIADPTVQIPHLAPRGNGTNFAAAFSEALARFRTDLSSLQVLETGQRRQVFRPTMYVVTDGEPNCGGDWRGPLAELKSRSWRPNVMAFGYRQARRDTIREIASEGMAYFAEDGQDPDTMFEKILEVILRSVISATVTGQQVAANPAAAAVVPVVDPAADKATAGLALIDPIKTID